MNDLGAPTATAGKATVPTGDLIRAAVATARVAPVKPRLPILTGALLHAGPRGMTLNGGLRFGVIRAVQGSDGSLPDVVVDARLLRDLVCLHDTTAPTTLSLNGPRLILTQERRSAELPALPVEDFPRPPDPPAAGSGYRLRGARLRALARSVVTVARDLSGPRPAPGNVHLRIDGTGADAVLRAAGTDRRRLAVADEPVIAPDSAEPFDVMVPADALRRAAAIVEATDQLSISVDQYRLWISDPSGAFFADLIVGEYPPDYESLLSRVSSTETVVDRDVLLTELRRLSVAARTAYPIRMTVDDDAMDLEAGNSDAVVVRSRIPVTGNPASRSVAVHAEGLRDALRSFSKGPVAIAFGPDARVVCLSRPADTRLRHVLAQVHGV